MNAITKLGIAVLALVGVLAGIPPAGADHLSSVKVINADQLKAWVDQGKTMVLIDSRIAAEYNAGHIPTAINIPTAVMDRYREKLPRDRNSLLVFYCNGHPECKKSHDASGKAVQWGYTNVQWFRDGIPAWQAKGYPVE
ncbi:MAG: rhodanese-like domain-containing protein [Candidatus Rokubacteria bacterium]|nr:rhodanese-like domain-containing protein [Candidatus Rokubacteria bacterium]